MAIPRNLFTLAPAACAMLKSLDGRKAGITEFVLLNVSPVKLRTGWLKFAIGLKNKSAKPSRSPAVSGIASGGGRGVRPWFECRLYPKVEIGGRLFDARGAGVEAALVEMLAQAIPAGGHLMLDYESAGQEQTFAELALRVPPAASYLGALMFKAGCRGEFKDWYFSEGGHEGPRKLQANKPPDEVSGRRALAAHLQQLRAFIQGPIPRDEKQRAVVRAAVERARGIVSDIRRQV